jgi:hypothetical protein
MWNGDTHAFSSEKKRVKSANRLGAMAEASTVLGWHSPIQYFNMSLIDAFCLPSSHLKPDHLWLHFLGDVKIIEKIKRL